VHDHFEQGDGGDADIFEVVGVLFPRLLILYGFLLIGVVAVEGIAGWVDKLYGVFELCLMSDFILGWRICRNGIRILTPGALCRPHDCVTLVQSLSSRHFKAVTSCPLEKVFKFRRTVLNDELMDWLAYDCCLVDDLTSRVGKSSLPRSANQQLQSTLRHRLTTNLLTL